MYYDAITDKKSFVTFIILDSMEDLSCMELSNKKEKKIGEASCGILYILYHIVRLNLSS